MPYTLGQVREAVIEDLESKDIVYKLTNSTKINHRIVTVMELIAEIKAKTITGEAFIIKALKWVNAHEKEF